MALSSTDLVQVLIGLVATAAGIGSTLRSLRKLRLSNIWVWLIGLILVATCVASIVMFPFVSTFIYLAGGAAAVGFVVGGIAWASRNHDVTVIALTIVCIVAVGGAFVWGVKNAQAQPTPVRLPGITSATATATPLFTTPTNTTAPTATRSPTTTTPSKASKASTGSSQPSGSSGGSGGSGTTGGVTATPIPTSQPVTPTPTPTPTPIPLTVTGASAAISSTTPNSCFPEVQVSGNITTNGGQGAIYYYWGRSDGSSSPSGTVAARTGSTSYGVSDDWYPQVNGSPTTYWDKLIVTGPNSAYSQASETLSC